MSAAAAQPVAAIDRDRYRAARDQCRRRSPDLFFAAHFTSRPRRYALYAVDALVHQLAEIMGPPQVNTSRPAIVSEQAAACCSTGGGCEGESLDQRRGVCLAVIEHLYGGLATGKPDLDAFLEVNRAMRLPSGWFELMVKGMEIERSLPRYATWKRLGDTLGGSGGMVAMLRAVILGLPETAITDTTRGQLIAWGSALRLCEALQSVGEDARLGRVMLPLDDLVKHRLSERDILRFAQRGTTGGDERWRSLMRFELDRVRNLLRGGAKAMSLLADQGARRTLAATGVFALKRLEKLVDAGGDGFSMRVTMGTWQRLTAMPRAVRVAWEAEKAGK